jgi:3-dehydroquinate dehydratase/shikimate dehydrogenase
MRGFGSGIGRICAVVAASTAAEMAALVRAAVRETPTVELRLDWLRSDAERARFLRWLGKNKPRRATFLATCRRREGGGRLSGEIAAELYWLTRAREAGCLWCDVEVETLRKVPGKSIREYAIPPGVLLSLHDFRRTPELSRVLNPASHGEVDATKIATHVRTMADSLRLLRFARRSRNCVVVPMGEVGLPARILALREGSVLAYAPVAEATAPGQVSLQDLKHLYRAHKLTNKTKIFGVIGDPIGHSLSPLLHNSGFIARKTDAVYLPFLVGNLSDFLNVARELGVRGFSVTLPHKVKMLKHLADCDPLAAEIGAVNTVVVRRDGSMYGSNTDCLGVLRALDKKIQLKGSRVLIFGAGGSARAAAFGLSRAGATVAICARRERAARELARAVNGEALPRRALRTEFFDAVLNATPVGMYPGDTISPLEPRELHCRIVMDLIYRPQKTQLLKLAARKGIATVSGVEMFLAQGIAQWEIWTKQRAPQAVMRRAVLAALRAEELQQEPRLRRPR